MKIILLIFSLMFAQSTGGDVREARKDILLSINRDNVSIFINGIWTEAEEVCRKNNLPLALLIAQSCLESGFGRSNIAKTKCNFLGIKRNGEYRTFANERECFEAWSKVMSQSCYDGESPSNLEEWIEALKTCKYAESKKYRRKVRSIIKSYRLNLIPEKL